jgi:hypothetical protein
MQTTAGWPRGNEGQGMTECTERSEGREGMSKEVRP